MSRKDQEARDALASLERKMHLVRDFVRGVVEGYATGFFLYGRGGVGKSFGVLSYLDELKANYRLYNSRMTAAGLLLVLGKYPDAIHVLEDMERLTNNQDAQGVLRSALWSQEGHDRVITWVTKSGGEERLIFEGGIIMMANRPLADLPELRALASRISVLKLEVNNNEIKALMYDLAGKGYRRGGKIALEPADCKEVAEYLIKECRTAKVGLDMRLLVNSWHDRLQYEADKTCCHWHDLVANRVRQAVHSIKEAVVATSMEERHEQRRQVVREVMAQTNDPEERVRLYCERTKKQRSDFYRRMQEVTSGEFS
jgi:hypothetical protein